MVAIGVGLGLSLGLGVFTPGATATTAVENDSLLGLPQPIDEFGPDATVFDVEVNERGTARWEVEYRYRLESERRRGVFRRVSANITNPPGAFRRNLSGAVETANNATERSMRLRNISVQTEVGRSPGNRDRVGIVRYRFEWTNFADRDGSRFVVGDETLSGFVLRNNQTLTVAWTDSFELRTVAPEPDANLSGEVRWSGPRRFQAAPTVELTRTTGTGIGLPLVPAAVGAVLLVVVAWVGRSRLSGQADEDMEDDDPAIDEELLTDEERVLRLLEAHGGRMKQQEVIDAVDWSRTKASDVVNEMNDAGQIEVYRLGRENVLALPGEVEI